MHKKNIRQNLIIHILNPLCNFVKGLKPITDIEQEVVSITELQQHTHKENIHIHTCQLRVSF